MMEKRFALLPLNVPDFMFQDVRKVALGTASYFIRLHRSAIRGHVEKIVKHIYPETRVRVSIYFIQLCGNLLF
jgi:hypothetical protein